MLLNVKTEILEHIGDKEVEFIRVAYRKSYGDDLVKVAGQLQDILPLLDFEYDNDYGGKRMDGYIWYTDGSWSSREDYDGKGWWRHQVRPPFDCTLDI